MIAGKGWGAGDGAVGLDADSGSIERVPSNGLGHPLDAPDPEI